MITDSYKKQATGREMTDLTTLMDRNRGFAEQFEMGDLTIRPRMSTIILTCVDARVDPAHLFGLGLGDAVVIRNAGGRITRAVMGDLGILGVLAANMAGWQRYAAGTGGYPSHRLWYVSPRQPGHSRPGRKKARARCRRK